MMTSSRLNGLLFRDPICFEAHFHGTGPELAAYIASRSAELDSLDRLRAHQLGPVAHPFRAKIRYPAIELALADVADDSFAPILQGRIDESGASSMLNGSIGLRSRVRIFVISEAIVLPLILCWVIIGTWFGVVSPLLSGDAVPRSSLIGLGAPVSIFLIAAFRLSRAHGVFGEEVDRLAMRIREEFPDLHL